MVLDGLNAVKYPEKRVMYLASEIPALSATFVYKEILRFEKIICPVEVVSIRQPESPADVEIQERFENRVTFLYESSLGKRLLSVMKMLFRRPLNFLKATQSFFFDLMSVGVITRNALGLGFRFTHAALLGLEMERRKVDHLHVHFAHVPADIAMYASLMTSIPFSVTGHANDIFERGWLLKQKVKRAKFFSTISEFNKRALEAKGCDSSNIEIVRCGIDQDDFEYHAPVVKENEVIRIGSLGRLVPKKGFQTLIEACELLEANSKGFVLEIGGDGPLMEELQSQVGQSDIAARVRFLGAMVHSDVSSWMRSLDIFALACCEDKNGDVDGIPVVLMEAMALGIPVVTTAISGLPELVVDESTGLISEQRDAKGLFQNLVRLSQDNNLRRQLSANAVEHIEEEFSLQANVAKLGDLISS